MIFLNYSYLYPAQQSTAIARHAFHFAVVLDDKLQQDEIHPLSKALTCLIGARK